MNQNVQRLPLSALPSALGGPIDVFVCSASYEARCISAAEVLADVVAVHYPLVCHNQKTVPEVYRSVERLERIFEGKGARIGLDKNQPLRTADALQTALSKVTDETRPLHYVLDITTFTTEALLILLRILQQQLRRKDPVELIYTTAAEYSVGLKPEEKWLAKGVQDVRSVLGYPGLARPSRKSHLIVLVGLDSDRAIELIDSYEPHVVSLGFGDPETPTEVANSGMSRLAYQAVARRIVSYKEFVFSPSDPFVTELAIRRQVEIEPGANVLIAPMNTKVSTVGAAGAAFANDDIRLCYASARIYNVQGYSRPSDHCFIIRPPYDFWRRREQGASAQELPPP